MSHITIEIPNETLLALKVSQEEAGEAVRMAALDLEAAQEYYNSLDKAS